MSAGKYNKFIVEQGATFSRVITWSDENNVVIDLTNYTARMQIRQSIGTTTTIVDLTTENGGITLGGVLGTITLLISATDTAAMDWNAGVYDLELVSPSGIVTRLLEGSIGFVKEVTR